LSGPLKIRIKLKTKELSMSKRNKRTRLSREEIIKKSTTQTSGGGNWFRLPEGVETWEPKEKGKFKIDVIPYETTSDNHPNEVAKGVVWYQHPFKVHHGVGADGKSIVCPTTVGKKCPICEEISRLSKNYDENEETIKSLRAQRYVAFNILHPDDPDKVAIFALSVGKFYNALEKEIQESDEDDIANFFDVTESGKTLKVRFSEASYAGKKYLEATKIEFIDREPMDEDEIFSKVVNLDEMFVVMEYDKLNALFLQTEDEAEEEEEKSKAKAKDKPTSKRAKPSDDEDDEDDEEEDDIPFNHPPKKEKSKPAKNEEEDEDEEDEKPTKKPTKTTKPSAKQKDEDEDEDDEEDEDEETPKKPLKSKASTKPTKQDEDEDEEDEDEEDEDEEDEEDEDDWGD
jgi:hypothetical protein